MEIRTGITFDDVLLVPQETSLRSRSEVDLSTQLTKKITLKTPIISANMDTVTESRMAIAMAQLGGIGFIHRFMTVTSQVKEVMKVKKENLPVGAAIGVKGDYVERADALLNAGCDVLVIDIAHGHSIQLIEALSLLKSKFKDSQIVAGNIATGKAAEDLISAGADCLKVGIGPGAFCTTRIVTGAGMPQLTAIMDIAEVSRKHNIPIIADGGIRYSGDIVKALAAGASTVMMGSRLVGCEESPAPLIEIEGVIYKHGRGMASTAANQARSEKDESISIDIESYTPEGVEGSVAYIGPVKQLLEKYLGGIKSGFSYCGARNFDELWSRAEFVQITANALVESHPHDVLVK